MGRSTSSCLKIIACGSDSVDRDGLEQTESKGSTDKRGWSFRKRSGRRNTIISETPSTVLNKESPESTTVDFHPQTSPTVHEKASVPQWTDETTQVSTSVNLKVTDPPIADPPIADLPIANLPIANLPIADPPIADPPITDPLIADLPIADPPISDLPIADPLITIENASKIDSNLKESVAIVIQSAIRGYLAQGAFLKLKNVVKLQAAVRGHLVRRQAVGTLRCVHAIVKMQALVRARRARLLVQGSVNEEKLERNNQNVKPLGEENTETKANKTYSSTEKLLSNGFARQLLESTPKAKPIHIKCDPSRPNSSWKWLERWMSVSSSDIVQAHKNELPENQEQGESTEATASEIEPEILAESVSVSVDLKSNTRETVTTLASEESLITYDADNFDFQACRPNCSSIIDDLDQPLVEDVALGEAHEASSKIDSHPYQAEKQSGEISQIYVSEEPEKDSEPPKRITKRVASDQLETEGKKFVFGSRKACNPAFVASQTKFEDLSSTATSGRSISSTYQDVGVESKVDNLSSPSDSVTRARDFSQPDIFISHDPKIQIGGSECGTELSITSTLDSPDRSEVGVGECENEGKVAETALDLHGTANNASNLGTLDLEAKNMSFMPIPDSSYPLSVHLVKPGDVNRESIDPHVAVDLPQVEQQPEKSVSDVQIQLGTVIDQQEYRSSPEGSPRSHIKAPESYDTPSSQVSIKAKRDKLNKNGPTQNRMTRSAGKKSPSNLNHDSGARSGKEQLPKDPKSGKRRNSFGSVRSDPIDQERRDSSSSNSLPNYMQATESAKAKAQAYNSPRSSPDVQDKDIHIKKRHSLPSANEKQGSPRMQQGAKGNGTHSPHDRKWQR